MFKVPEKYRVTNGILKTTSFNGNNGVFTLKIFSRKDKRKLDFICIAEDKEGWEHVSVSIKGIKRCPNWNEMCFIKDMFWGKEDFVMQFHPPKSEYVNIHSYTLHLWRHSDFDFIDVPKKRLYKTRYDIR